MKKIGSGAVGRSISLTLSHSLLALTLLILPVPATVKSDNEPTFTTIDFPGANISTAWAINSEGDIIGSYTYGDQHPQVGTIIDQPGYGFILSPDGFTSIQLPGAFHTLPYAINDSGTIVGVYEEAFNNKPNRKVHCFQLSLGYLTSFDFPGAKSNSAWGINSAGDIVGRYVAVDGTAHGFLLHDGEFTSIDYPGAISTWARGITPSGDIMGLYTAADGTGHGFILRDGEFTSIDYPGAIFTNALGINAPGDIVGRYDSADGRQHGYVLRNIGCGNCVRDCDSADGRQPCDVLRKGRFTSIDFPGASRTVARELTCEARSWENTSYRPAVKLTPF